MDTNNLMKIIVSAVIGVVVFAAILVPVIGDATTTHKTFTNEGIIDLNYVDDTFEETIVWDYTEPAKLTIGSDEIDLPTTATYAVTLIANEDFFIRWYYSGTNGATSFVQLYKTDDTSPLRANAADSQSMTITISNGSLSANNGTTTSTISFTNMYCICSADGDYVMKDASSTAYIKSDSEIFAYGGSSVAGLTIYTIIDGTPADDFALVTWPESLTATFGDLNEDLAEVSGYNGLYALNKFTYSVTNTNTSATGTVTFSQFIVPAEVTVELSVHPGTSEIALLNIIPLLILVGLVLGVVGAVLARRD